MQLQGQISERIRFQASLEIASLCLFYGGSSSHCNGAKAMHILKEVDNKHFRRRIKHSVTNQELKKEIFLLRARGGEQYKNQKLIWLELTFLSLVVCGGWI